MINIFYVIGIILKNGDYVGLILIFLPYILLLILTLCKVKKYKPIVILFLSSIFFLLLAHFIKIYFTHN